MMREIVVDRDVGDGCRALHAPLDALEARQRVHGLLDRDACGCGRRNRGDGVLEVVHATDAPARLGRPGRSLRLGAHLVEQERFEEAERVFAAGASRSPQSAAASG